MDSHNQAPVQAQAKSADLLHAEAAIRNVNIVLQFFVMVAKIAWILFKEVMHLVGVIGLGFVALWQLYK